MADLTHIGAHGRAKMVDVGGKATTRRRAVARGEVRMAPATLARIRAGGIAKGDVLAVAQVAAIMAAKRTGELIPLCHPLPISGVDVRFAPGPDGESIWIEATALIDAQTGVEMEALAAISAAALTIYDMCKAIDKGMSIERIRLVHKSGGRSGDYERAGEPAWPEDGL
ncbi:MAG TPA: cyclic pyranopterin monophosphate synthase MoaC [Limnochordia bacterium]|nr:cyclic pyranopterin monophosphate synthase MoaC [Limnochordia bacterium]